MSEIRIKTPSEFSLHQAWMQLAASPWIRPKLGLYLVPFGKYNQANRPHQTALIEFPLPVDYLIPRDWRDLGLMLEGRVFGLNYAAYAGNGIQEAEYLSGGQQFKDGNGNKSLGFRLDAPLGQGLEVSYSFYRSKYDPFDSRTLSLHAFSGNWTTEGFQIRGEYYRAGMENPEDFNSGEAEGYYLQLTVNLGGFRPVGSYQKLEYNDPFHGPGFMGRDQPGAGIDIGRSRWTLGLNYIRFEKAVLKLEYQFRDTGSAEEGGVLIIQAALSF